MAVFRHFTDNAISSDRFSFKNNTFVCEASDLNGFNLFKQIYDDACDVGIAIRSEKTGRVVKFHFADQQHDADGDITKWIFHVTPDHGRDPTLKDLKVIVFND